MYVNMLCMYVSKCVKQLCMLCVHVMYVCYLCTHVRKRDVYGYFVFCMYVMLCMYVVYARYVCMYVVYVICV